MKNTFLIPGRVCWRTSACRTTDDNMKNNENMENMKLFKFVGFSSLGALIQLGMVYVMVDNYQFAYSLALILAVITAASSNFILNKKWTFKEKVWS